jgi:hypothetical protein
MEKLKKYQQILVAFLEEYARINYANAPQLEQQVVADLDRNHFQLITIGWHKKQFLYDVVFHFDIKDGVIWIQQNWADIKLADELVRRGVSPTDIQVGFLPVLV